MSEAQEQFAEKQSSMASAATHDIEVIATRDLTADEKVEALRRVHVFADLPEVQLRWFADNAFEQRRQPGEILFRKGDPPEYMTVYLEGEIEARREETSLDTAVYTSRAGDPASEVSVMLPFSRMTEFPSTSRPTLPSRLLLFPVNLFPEMLQHMPLLAERLVWLMSDRVRESTKQDQQRDKLMALGKLSAGLTHELNNPAAAARRAAKDLREALDALREANESFCRHELSAAQHESIAAFERNLLERAAEMKPLNSITRSDREDELTTWLEAREITRCWAIAPTLVEAGVQTSELADLERAIGAEALNDALSQLTAQLSTAKLTSEIETSMTRISELVGAIKEYSYMDRAAIQEVDLHKGVESTLVILNHKVKKGSVRVTRDYATDIPPIIAYGSELNQVWTNLLDNAIDAMTEGGVQGGELTIRTERKDDGMVCVHVTDTGGGIPPEVQACIFEPFFTTKGVGEGTGLGLDTAYRIVRKHHGILTFISRPGQTRFTVQLPVRQMI